MDITENPTKFEFFSDDGGRSVIFNIGTYFQDFDFSKYNIDAVKKNVDSRKVFIDDLNEYLRKEPILTTITKVNVGDKVIHWERLTHWGAIIHNESLNKKGNVYCKVGFSAIIDGEWCGPFYGYGTITWS
jgi:hypothetical protein